MNIILSEDESSKVKKLAREWGCPEEEALQRLVKKGLEFYNIPSKEPWPNFYLLGAPPPWRKSEKSKFINDLERRFSNSAHALEDAFKYIDVVTDRIIGKGVGLLQFNAILFVLLVWAFEHYAKNILKHQFLLISIFCSLVSSVMMFILMFTVWRKTGYDNTEFNLEWMAKLCMFRSNCMTAGLILSVVAATLASITYIIHEFHADNTLRPEPPSEVWSLVKPHIEGIETLLDSAGAILSAIQKNLETAEAPLNRGEATLSAIQKNLETVEAPLNRGGATLSVIQKNLDAIDEQLLGMRLAQPVNLSYLTGANCRPVQQVLQELAVYQGRVDGICDGATNAAAWKWQMQERRTIAPAHSTEEIVWTLHNPPSSSK